MGERRHRAPRPRSSFLSFHHLFSPARATVVHFRLGKRVCEESFPIWTSRKGNSTRAGRWRHVCVQSGLVVISMPSVRTIERYKYDSGGKMNIYDHNIAISVNNKVHTNMNSILNNQRDWASLTARIQIIGSRNKEWQVTCCFWYYGMPNDKWSSDKIFN